MPTIQRIHVKKAKGEDAGLRISVSFKLPKGDPRTDAIFEGIGLLLKHALTEEELAECRVNFAAARRKLRAA